VSRVTPGRITASFQMRASSGKLRLSPITILATAPMRVSCIIEALTRPMAIRTICSNGRSSCAAASATRADVGAHRLAHDRGEQVLLGLVVEVERALADAGAPGDLVQPGAAKPFSAKHLERRGHDLRRPLRLAPPPLRLTRREHGWTSY
jgi:hypothetical protein